MFDTQTAVAILSHVTEYVNTAGELDHRVLLDPTQRTTIDEASFTLGVQVALYRLAMESIGQIGALAGDADELSDADRTDVRIASNAILDYLKTGDSGPLLDTAAQLSRVGTLEGIISFNRATGTALIDAGV